MPTWEMKHMQNIVKQSGRFTRGLQISAAQFSLEYLRLARKVLKLHLPIDDYDLAAAILDTAKQTHLCRSGSYYFKK